MTSQHNDALSAARMELAEAITDASRSLDRDRKRVERLRDALTNLQRFDSANDALRANIERCQVGIVELQTLNNDVRKMS